MKKIIVVSAVNLVDGGPLVVLRECLQYLSDHLSDRYEITALVHRRDLFEADKITYVEFPLSKKSWLNRLYYEYYGFYHVSKRLAPFLWLSLHDMTPRVLACRQAVYCHNASPFYRLSLREAALDPKFALFNLFYRYLYEIGIRKNAFVIVQQDWLREAFYRIFRLKNIVVAQPRSLYQPDVLPGQKNGRTRGKHVFFYPSFPRVFKNFEVICQAAEILSKQGIHDFEVLFTLSGQENAYAKHIYNSYRHVSQIQFIGLQDQRSMQDLYRTVDCVIFPSKLESWGLPITEAKAFDKPILLADLAYAHEALGNYDKAKFFSPKDPKRLAHAMKAMLQGTMVFDRAQPVAIAEPFAQSWKELFDILLA